MAARRVLVTGPNTWVNATVIQDASLRAWGDGAVLLVSGACPQGAGPIAETFWTRWGGQVQRHPVDWSTYARGAGFRRNAEMVRRGADVCLAFSRDGSYGASHTARLTKEAGIPTTQYLANGTTVHTN